MPPDDFPASLSELGASSLADRKSAPDDDRVYVSVRGPVVSARSTAGVAVAMRDLKRVAVFELAEPLARGTTDGVKDDVPSALASPVWYFPADSSGVKNEYLDAGGSSRSMRVYHVGGLPGDRRDQLVALDGGEPGELGIPRFVAGDRVVTTFNNQSGRWEIVAPAEDVWRFELKTAMVPGEDPDVPAMADAYLVVYDAAHGQYVTTGVEFPVADFLHRFDAASGCRGYAKRLADSQPDVGWEVLALKTTP